jgi:hypothetical protein
LAIAFYGHHMIKISAESIHLGVHSSIPVGGRKSEVGKNQTSR